MNRKTTYPLSSGDGMVYLKGCSKPLPQQIATAITELGNPTLRSSGEARLRKAMEPFGSLLSREEIRDMLVANNGVSIGEAQAIASELQL